MEPWKEVCIYVSVYATLREFRLMDPFLTDYLTHLPENYSIETLGREVYPVGSYVNVLFVVIVFLVTDYLRYKPIMILSGLSSIISYSLLLGSPSLIALKASQIFQMFFKAAEVAYLTYMFASIKDKNQYQIATSRVRTSVMIGKFSCGILAEVLKSCSFVSYTFILYLSILGMALTTIWSFIMPSVKFSLYFYKEKPVVHEIVIDNREIVRTKIIDSINVDLGMANIKKNYIKMKCTEVVQKLWTDFKVAYEDPNVFKWSVWWSLSLCGYVLVSQYIQLLWQEIIIQHDKDSTLRNGAVESLATLFSAVAAYAIGSLDNDWDKNGELIMAVVSIGLGVMISALAYAKSLMISYIYYVVFYSTFQTMLTISSVEVAKFLKRDCYALVFGFNKCITNILITILTVVIVRDSFFSIGIQEKFFIYGLYFVFLGCLFLIMYFMSFWRL